MAKATKKTTKKAAAKKATTKKAATKKAAPAKATTKKAAPKKAATKRKVNPAFMKALTPTPALAAIVGPAAMPRTQATKKIWDYIKKHNLQDTKNRRNINADDKLKTVFGKATFSMFEIGTALNKHLK